MARRKLRQAKRLGRQARDVARGYRQATHQLRGRVAWTAPVIQFLESREGANREVTATTMEYIDAVLLDLPNHPNEMGPLITALQEVQ
eukprot:10581944-Prorocentrum_lima.AAC.1